MGEYLHYAVAAANGGVYAGIDGIGYTTIFRHPFGLRTKTTGLTCQARLASTRKGLLRPAQWHQPRWLGGRRLHGRRGDQWLSIQYAVFWVNGVESLVPAPPDNPTPTIMSATGVSGDGTTLIVQDQAGSQTESYVFNIASGTFTSLGFFPGNTNQQTYATAINKDGTIVAGYYNLDDGDIHGFLWNATNGLTDMGIPAGYPNTHYLEPTCISDDGTTVFGQLTEWNGWVGFRYNTTTGFQDRRHRAERLHGGWNGSGRNRKHVFPGSLVGGKRQRLCGSSPFRERHPAGAGNHLGSVTISPDGSAITALGPDAYPVDQIWYGTWQVSLPAPLENGGVSAGQADLFNALPGDAQRAGWNAHSICGVHHRRVCGCCHEAALRLRVCAERGRLVQLYSYWDRCHC